MAETEPLPLVPATCTQGSFSGSTSMARISASVVSSPSLTVLPPVRLYR